MTSKKEANEPQRKRIKPSPVIQDNLKNYDFPSDEKKTHSDILLKSSLTDYKVNEKETESKGDGLIDKKVEYSKDISINDNKCDKDNEQDHKEYEELEHGDDCSLSSDSSVESNQVGIGDHDETEKENMRDNDATNISLELPSTNDKPKEILDLEKKLKDFLKVVQHAIKKSQFEDVIQKKCLSVQKYFNKCGNNINEKGFIKLLRDSMCKMENSTAAGATIAFHQIYEHLKLLSAKSEAEVMPEDVHRVRKLENMLTLLMKKINKLEQTEIDFDDEEDSTYMQIDRYKQRVKKVYEKYCELINKNPNSGRLTYEKLNFARSSYKKINDAINKKYKNSLNFPTYYEMEQFIRAVVKENRLDVPESKVKSESKKCFKVLGKILQQRRRAELYDCHLSFIEGTYDPANEDAGLEERLKKNLVEGEEKFNKLLFSYNVMAEKIKDENQEADSCESSNESG